MPPKKATTTKKSAAPASHASYKDMIKEAILNLKERNGSSRQAIKKYVLANNKINPSSQASFDSQFNRAIKAGVASGDFTQPKGQSGPIKLAKKEAPKKPAAAKPDAAKKATKPKTTKKTATKSAAPKKAAAKPKVKANASKPRKKTTTAAPAVTPKATVLTKTKSGRVAKTTKPAAAKKAAPKKASTKKAAPKKEAA